MKVKELKVLLNKEEDLSHLPLNIFSHYVSHLLATNFRGFIVLDEPLCQMLNNVSVS